MHSVNYIYTTAWPLDNCVNTAAHLSVPKAAKPCHTETLPDASSPKQPKVHTLHPFPPRVPDPLLPESVLIGDTSRLRCLKGATNAKHESGSLRRLLCPDNSNANLIASFNQMIEISEKTYEAVVTAKPPHRNMTGCLIILFEC